MSPSPQIDLSITDQEPAITKLGHSAFNAFNKNFGIGLATMPILGEDAAGVRHSHDFFELAIIAEGTGRYYYRGVEYMLMPGDTFVIPPNTVHHYLSQSSMRVLNILWYPDELPIAFSTLHAVSCLRVFLDLEPKSRNYFHFEKHLRMNPTQLSEVKRLFYSLDNEITRRDDGAHLRATCLFFELLIVISRFFRTEHKVRQDNELFNMQDILDFLDKNYTTPLRRPEVARHFAMGDRSFANQFTNIMGETFSAYLMNLRMQHAQQLLRETPLTLADIAAQCGFCDANYFCLCFRKLFNMTPGEYRKKGYHL